MPFPVPSDGNVHVALITRAVDQAAMTCVGLDKMGASGAVVSMQNGPTDITPEHKLTWSMDRMLKYQSLLSVNPAPRIDRETVVMDVPGSAAPCVHKIA